MVSGNIILPVLSWTGSALQLAALISIAVIGASMSLAEFAERFSWIITTSLVLIVIVDILNTGGLCYFLFTERSRNQIRRSVSMLY